MKDKDYIELIDLTYVGGGFIPANEKARDLELRCVKGEIVTFKEWTVRDLKFHRCYFSLLNFIYAYLPEKFKKQIPEQDFYRWLKHLKGSYEIVYTFKDGTKMVEYESISFGNMSQKRFKDYVANQLPFIYENVIGAFYEGEIYSNIIETIEEAYEKFMAKL